MWRLKPDECPALVAADLTPSAYSLRPHRWRVCNGSRLPRRGAAAAPVRRVDQHIDARGFRWAAYGSRIPRASEHAPDSQLVFPRRPRPFWPPPFPAPGISLQLHGGGAAPALPGLGAGSHHQRSFHRPGGAYRSGHRHALLLALPGAVTSAAVLRRRLGAGLTAQPIAWTRKISSCLSYAISYILYLSLDTEIGRAW